MIEKKKVDIYSLYKKEKIIHIDRRAAHKDDTRAAHRCFRCLQCVY